jgi:imidazolonepropionase-like amidohydrolase
MFIDSHIHLSLDGKNSKLWRKHIEQKKYQPLLNILRLYKTKGIKALRDGGDSFGISLAAKPFAEELGIIYKTPGWAIYKEGCYGAFIGRSVADLHDFQEVFDELLKVKPDHLKVILTGIVDFNSYGKVGDIGFSFEEMRTIILRAKDKGLPVMVHVNSQKAVSMAIKAGADTIEHGYFITDEEIHAMAENDVVWVPTLAPLGNIIESRDVRYSNQLENIKLIYDLHTKNIKKAIQIGVKVAIGSDAGAYGVYHGSGFFDECRHMRNCGISEEEIHKIFQNGAKALGLKASEIKSIE